MPTLITLGNVTIPTVTQLLFLVYYNTDLRKFPFGVQAKMVDIYLHIHVGICFTSLHNQKKDNKFKNKKQLELPEIQIV